MECTECDTGSATSVTVEYTNGRAETLTLCVDCREAFDQGEFVENVSVDDR